MMGVMTTQQLLPLTPAGAVLIGDAAALVADDDGGRVFIRGELCNAWDAGDDLGRRLAAVQLVRIKAATAMAVATAFGVTTVTLWRWRKELDTSGAQGLAQDKRGPKGPSRLTPEVVADIASRRRGGASLRAMPAAVGASPFSVRRALTEPTPEPEQAPRTEDPQPQPQPQPQADAEDGLPLLPPPADRDGERPGARWGSCPTPTPCSPRPQGCPWPGCCWRSPHCRPPACCLVREPRSGACRRGSRRKRPCSSKESYGPWPGSLAPKAPPGSTRTRWAGSWVWTGARKSRPSAARSPPWLPQVGPTSCSPRWPPPTSPGWTRATRTCWRCSTSTGTSAPTKAAERSPRPTCPG